MTALLNMDQLLDQLESGLREQMTRRGIESPTLIGIRTGGVWVAQALLEALGRTDALGILDVSFYRDDFTQNGLHPQVQPSELPERKPQEVTDEG